MRLIFFIRVYVVEYHIVDHFRRCKDVRLFKEWARIRGGAYLIIMCLGWAIRGGRLIEALR